MTYLLFSILRTTDAVLNDYTNNVLNSAQVYSTGEIFFLCLIEAQTKTGNPKLKCTRRVSVLVSPSISFLHSIHGIYLFLYF